MKKILSTLLLLFALSTVAQAQFSQGTKYVSTSLSNLSMSYSDKSDFRIGLQADGGYFIADCLLLRGSVGFNHYGKSNNEVVLGLGARYYFLQNGVSIGTGLEYAHISPNINDLRIPVDLGYTFYLNHYVSIEPALYYKVSLNDFTKGSEVGFRLGLGFYF